MGKDHFSMKSALSRLHSADIAETMVSLTDEERETLFQLLDDRTAAEVLDGVDSETQAGLLDDLELSEIAALLNAMPLDEAADLLGQLEEKERLSVLQIMKQETADKIRQLMKHKDDSAGGIMTPEIFSVYPEKTAEEVIDKLRHASLADEIISIYVVNEQGRLLGMVPLRKLITAPKDQPVGKLMLTDVVTVQADMDQEEAARYALKYDLLAIPVVDTDGRLVGRITMDDVMEVMEEEASQDMLRLAGTTEQTLETRSVLSTARLRIPWLLVCLLGCTLSAIVLEHFGATLAEAVALAFFIPAIMAMGGNSGIQTSTTVVRGLATGTVKKDQLYGLLLREIRVALVIGMVCGLLASIPAYWLTGMWLMGLIVGVSLACAMIVAVTGGVLWPMLGHSLGIDPAVAAGPFITTTNDITGLLIYFFIASTLLRLWN